MRRAQQITNGLLLWFAPLVAMVAAAALGLQVPVELPAHAVALAPLPALLEALLQGPAALTGLEAMDLCTLLVAAATVAAWQASLRQDGLSLAAVASVSLFLAANPLWLLLLQTEGAAGALMLLGAWTAGAGLMELRAYPGAPPAMAVGLGLLIAVLSHPAGIFFALIAAPLFVLAAPPAMLKRSGFGLTLGLLFPVGFAFLGLLFIRWILFGDTPADFRQATPELAFGRHALVAMMCATCALSGPILALILRSLGRWPILTPAVALLLTALVFAAVGGFVRPASPVLSAAPAIAFAAVSIAFQPEGRWSFGWALGLAAFNFVIGGLVAVTLKPELFQGWVG